MELAVTNLRKNFGDKEVLKGISFTAERGRAFGLLGRNGAGKTTTMRIIMDVFRADGGGVFWKGAPLDRAKARIGYLPEERGLYPKKPIDEQLVYFACLRGASPKEAKKSMAYWLERFGMSEYTKKKLETLSKGNQQKIQLALTMMCSPDIVILDEPFSGLDPVNAQVLKSVVRECISDDRVVLFSSHQMGYVEEFCDDVAMLHRGSIALSGSLRDIKRGDGSRLLLRASEGGLPALTGAVRAFGGAELVSTDAVKGDERNGTVTVSLKARSDKNALLAFLASERAPLEAFGPVEPTLEEIFVRYCSDSDETKEAPSL